MKLNVASFIALAMLAFTSVCCARPLVLILGDSLSAAYQIPQTSSWITLLEKKLKTSYPESTLINSSVAGDTTANGLARLPNLLSQYQPNITIIELGGNDGLRGLPIHTIKKNLYNLIQLCLQAHSQVLLIGMLLPPNYGLRYQTQFEKIYPELSETTNVALVPFLLHNVALTPHLMQPDGMHPTEAAQPILLENVWPHLAPLLEATTQ